MPLTFCLQHHIAAPAERVFQAMTDLDLMRQWMQGLVRLEPLTPGSIAPGSEWREVRRMFGQEAAETFRVEAMVPNRSYTLYVDGTKGSSRKGYYRFQYTLTPSGGGTDLAMDAEVGGMGGKVAELIGRLFLVILKKACARDHEALGRFLEARANAGRASAPVA
jgi:uncharacterized protein YndB with AHSA1/START domain